MSVGLYTVLSKPIFTVLGLSLTDCVFPEISECFDGSDHHTNGRPGSSSPRVYLNLLGPRSGESKQMEV